MKKCAFDHNFFSSTATRKCSPLHESSKTFDFWKLPSIYKPKEPIFNRNLFITLNNVDPNSLLKNLRGQAFITLDIAERLVKALTGSNAAMWLLLQANYDSWQSEHGQDAAIKEEKNLDHNHSQTPSPLLLFRCSTSPFLIWYPKLWFLLSSRIDDSLKMTK